MIFPTCTVGDRVLLKGWQPEDQRRGVVTDVSAAPMVKVRMTASGAEIAIASFALVADEAAS